MAVRSGRFRHRFELLKHATDENGDPLRNDYGELTDEYEVVSRPWCNVVLVNSSENASTMITGQEQINFEVRYSKMLENPTNDMVIRFEGELYDITSSVDVYKRREKLTIFAIKRR